MKEVNELLQRYPILSECCAQIEAAIALLTECYRNGGKVLVCGNGGSASDALHIVGELMKGFVKRRRLSLEMKETLCGFSEKGEFLYKNLQGALPAISLVNEVALQTAYANDVAPVLNFAQQVWGQGNAGDVLIGITTSGNSENVIYASQVAHAKGMRVIALTGYGGGKIQACADVLIAVPERETYKIQELHLPVYHAICLALEDTFFEDRTGV
ncbi:MAG: SIS domain-containing protein [Clostridia bacterium]|nr:SIS domain-containing protein [Clostridia bacterium]